MLWLYLSYLFSIFGFGLVQSKVAVEPCFLKDLTGKEYTLSSKLVRDLDLFVHKGLDYHPIRMFTDVFIQLNLTDDDTYRLYQGANCSSVLDEYEQDNRLFGLLRSVSAWRSHHLNPFNDTVIGVDTSLSYTISIKIWKVNYIRAAVFVVGVLLFIFASGLVRNTLFYYSSGCSFGLIASLLLVGFIMYRVAPKKLIGIPMLIGGWSMSVYMLHFAWNNFASIMMQYQKFVIAYFVTVLLISLAICYKRGPPTDSRSHDLAQWGLQLIALILIYFSSQIPEVSLAVTGLLVLHQIAKSWIGNPISGFFNMGIYMWRRFFPKKRRLLTEEEYEREGRENTKKELDKLRSFCRSPEANVWKITRNVHDPKKFARFVDGSEEHISDDEEREYDEYDHDYSQRYPDRQVDYNYKDVEEDDDEDDWEEEIIIRRAPRNPSRPGTSQSIRVPRGTSDQFLASRLSGTPSGFSSMLASANRQTTSFRHLNNSSISSTPRRAVQQRHQAEDSTDRRRSNVMTSNRIRSQIPNPSVTSSRSSVAHSSRNQSRRDKHNIDAFYSSDSDNDREFVGPDGDEEDQ